MADQSRSSAFQDPLKGVTGLSLLPQTLKSLSTPLQLHEPDDPLHVHEFFKERPQEGQSGVLERGKFDTKSNSELPSHVLSEDRTEVAKANSVANRERRPGLDLERKARFHFRPNTTQPTACPEPTFDPDKYQKAEDLFLAFEKFENAKREWRKQMGISVVELDYSRPRSQRQRPGLPRKNPGKYRHLYSTAASQPILEDNVMKSTDHSTHQEATKAPFTSPVQELDVTETENEGNQVLDDLLSTKLEVLDGDGLRKLLEERLQVKPLNLEKLCYFDLEDIQRPGSTKETLGKRTLVLSDTQNMLSGNNGETKTKKLRASSSQRSSLASLASLRKQILLPESQGNRFSLLDNDNLSVELSLSRDAGEQYKEADIADVTILGGTDSIDGDIAAILPDNSGNDSASKAGIDSHIMTSNSHSGVEVNNKDNFMHGGNIVRDSRQETDSGVTADKPNSLNDKVNDMLQEEDFVQQDPIVVNSMPQVLTDTQSRLDNMQVSGAEVYMDNQSSDSVDAVLMQDHYIVNTMLQKSNDISRQSEDMDLSGAEAHAENQSCISGSQAQHNKKTSETCRKQVKRQSNARPRASREFMAFSRRKSLADAGTLWECGVRRSARIRSRPLEYWRGERFLYGRIYDSLPTVIGIKYESPEKDKTTTGLKVISFVPDKFKERVDLAALH